MGQEVSVTPLQLVRVAAAIANGGRLVRPRLVRRIVHPGGRVDVVVPAPPDRILSEATARTVRELLVGAVRRGTGRKATIPGFVVAGKTGTAQKAGVGGYQPGKYVSSFVGFAPSENPKIVGLVLIEEPRGRYYGGEIAAPVFSRVVSQALGILRVAPEDQRLPENLLASSSTERIQYPAGVIPVSVRSAVEAPPVFSGPPESPTVASDGAPSALGLSARQALALFARRGLLARIEGSGFVVAQQPLPGARVRAGTTCILRLAEPAGPASELERRAEETNSPPPAP
jgi:membrane peptidoglycan carboxypeptidase